LFFPSGRADSFFFPAKVVSIDEQRIGIQWVCDSLRLGSLVAAPPTGSFTNTLAQWQEAAAQSIDISQVSAVRQSLA
jgi:hypothetical protein